MRHTHTHNLYAYWDKLRSGRIAPFRSEIDPRSIASLLESTFILEYLGQENIRYRLAGTKLCENFGMELRGMSALALWHGNHRMKMTQAFNKIISTPCVACVSCELETQDNQVIEAEYLYLPLRSDFGDISRILGCGIYTNSQTLAPSQIQALYHTIKCITYIDINIDIVDNAPRTREDYSLLPSSAIMDSSHQQRIKRSVGSPPLFYTIQGGNDSNQDHARNRNHLRLIP